MAVAHHHPQRAAAGVSSPPPRSLFLLLHFPHKSTGADVENLLPRSHPDRAVFHSNRAACLMLLRPVDHEAVAAECSLALQSQPLHPCALDFLRRSDLAIHPPSQPLRRARALDSLRRARALDSLRPSPSTPRSLLSVDPTNPEAVSFLKKLLQNDVSPAAAVVPTTNQEPSLAALGASALRGPCLPARPPRSPPIKNPSEMEEEEEGSRRAGRSGSRKACMVPSSAAKAEPRRGSNGWNATSAFPLENQYVHPKVECHVST